MHRHLISGTWGESLAADFLRDKEFEILERNWRYKRAEIDLVARDRGVLVFIEVKTRAHEYFGRPEEMVSNYKKLMLFDAAGAYMRQIGYEWEIRFDIVAVTGTQEKLRKLEHFPDAFYPGM